jgi:TRAP transporter TAXI family solute receptor
MEKNDKVKGKMVVLVSFLAFALAALPLFFVGGTKAAAEEKKPKHEARQILLPSWGVGSLAYINAHGLAEIVNRESEWLRVTAVESGGYKENWQMAVAKPEEIIAYGNPTNLYPAKIGAKPWDKPQPMQIVVSTMEAGVAFCTLDPTIKTFSDLKGKIVMVPHKGGDYHPLLEGLLSAHGMGLKDLRRLTYGLWGRVADSLKNGTIDVGVQGTIEPATLGSLNPQWAQLVATKDVYYLRFTKEEIEAAKKKHGYPWEFGFIKKEKNPRFTMDVPYRRSWNVLLCHPDMDDDIITELLSILYENYRDLVKYHRVNKALIPEKFADCGVAKENFHPASIKFFDKHRIPFPPYAYWGKK